MSNDLTLPLEGRHATSVRWHSSIPEVISTNGFVSNFYSTNGVVSRSNSNTTVILTATLSRGSVTDTKAFHLTVIVAPVTDIKAVELAKEALEIEYASGESSNAVSNDLILPLEGRHATAVRWHSSIPEIISTNGVVSNFYVEDITVILTATLSRGSVTDTKAFPLTVINEKPLGDALAMEEFLNRIAKNIEIGYAPGESSNAVSNDIDPLPLTGPGNVTIKWLIVPPNISTNGIVTRATNTQRVTLYASVEKWMYRGYQTFYLTVIGLPDLQAVEQARNALKIRYASGESSNAVSNDLILPLEGMHATAVRWHSSIPEFISTNGVVSRSNSNTTVILTATLSKGSVTDTKAFPLTVIAAPITDARAVELAKEALEIEYASGESSNAVSNDLILPLEGMHATAVRWHSSIPEFISTNGVVSRSNSNTTVILTATLSRGSVTDTKVFSLTVIAAPITDIRAVELAKEALEIEYAAGESSNAVSNDLTLPLEGMHATAVRWHSSIPEFISTNGVVSTFYDEDITVILTATLSRGSVTDTKAFHLTVIGEDPVDNYLEVSAFLKRIATNIEIGYAPGESSNAVSNDIDPLPLTGPGNVTIGWVINPSNSLSINGIVTRTTNTQRVTLYVSVHKRPFAGFHTFYLTVIGLPDLQAVEQARNALKISYASGESSNAVSNDLILPLKGRHATAVRWHSSIPEIISTNGVVSRNNSNTTVILTATLSRGSATQTKAFPITVIAVSDARAVELAKEALEIGYASGESSNGVSNDLTLPKGRHITTVRWESSRPEVVSTNGVVSRPGPGQPNISVVLTATLNKGSVTDTKAFTLTVTAIIPGVDWSLASDGPWYFPRSSHSSVVFKNKIWIIGGIIPVTNNRVQRRSDAVKLTNQIWSSADGSNWSLALGEFSSRDGHSSVVFDNKIWVIGGRKSYSNWVNDVWWSEDGANWSLATSNASFYPRAEHSSVVFDNKIWVIGGRKNYGTGFNDVWWSTNGSNWSLATSNAGFYDRVGHSSVVFDNKIWVIAGRKIPAEASILDKVGDVWSSSDGTNWTQATSRAPFGPLAKHSSVVFDNKIWIIGGLNKQSLSRNDVWSSRDGMSWQRITGQANFSVRHGHSSVIFDNRMWVIMGDRSARSIRDGYRDIWSSP